MSLGLLLFYQRDLESWKNSIRASFKLGNLQMRTLSGLKLLTKQSWNYTQDIYSLDNSL